MHQYRQRIKTMNQKQQTALGLLSTETNHNIIKSRAKALEFTFNEYDGLVLFLSASSQGNQKKQSELTDYISAKKEELAMAKSISAIAESAERVSVIKMHIETAESRLKDLFKEAELLGTQKTTFILSN